MQSHNHVKPNSVEVVLRLSWDCDNLMGFDTIEINLVSAYFG